MSIPSPTVVEKMHFDTQKYPFHRLIAGFLGVGVLESLSATNKEEMQDDWSFYKNMEQSFQFRKLYEKLDGKEGEQFYKLYLSFIKNEIRPLFDDPIYYQIKPSHRIFFKDLKGEIRFHKDRDYGHHPAEINYFVPQTAAFDTNTLWIESEEGKGDYLPVELEIGEYACFNGVGLRHGAMKNASGRTRVSFDFRILPVSAAPKDFMAKSPAGSDSGNPVQDNALKFAYCE